MDSKLWILLNPASDQVNIHSETALDTPKIEGTESSFPEKMHLIVPSVKWQVFTDDLKKLVLIAPLRGANVVQNPKENRKPLKSRVCDLKCTQKTICFRTSLWKTWDEYIVSESISHRLMTYKNRGDKTVCRLRHSPCINYRIVPQYKR